MRAGAYALKFLTPAIRGAELGSCMMRSRRRRRGRGDAVTTLPENPCGENHTRSRPSSPRSPCWPRARPPTVATRHINEPPPSLEDIVGMPPSLEDVIHKALAKSPSDRFATAADLLAALHECTDALGWSPRIASGDGDASLPRDTHAQPAAPGQTDSSGMPALEIATLLVEASMSGDRLTVRLAGELEDGPELRALASYLGDVIESTKERLGRVVLDVSGLGFLGMQGIACLSDWLAFLRDARADGLSPTTVRHSETASWQRAMMSSLQRADPALRLEAVE